MLTDVKIRGLKPAERRYTVTDGVGLVLQVQLVRIFVLLLAVLELIAD